MPDDDLLAHALHTWGPEDSAAPAVSVNGVTIPNAAINIESAYHETGSIDARQHQAATALVIRELLRQRAIALELLTTDAELDDAAVDRLMDAELTTPEPDTASCRRYFDTHRDQFRNPDLFEVSHILIAAAPHDEEARARAREKARGAIDALAGNPGRLAEMAATLSDCPSKQNGGDLGQIGKGQTVAEFEQVLFRMHEGELSRNPVETRYGYHVIYLRRRIDGAPLPFDAVHEQIAGYLVENVRRQAMHQYLQLLVGNADIRGIALDGADTPLVQ